MSTAKIYYIICFTNRSGSAFLGTALKNTGLAGDPRDHLIDFYHKIKNDDFEEDIEKYISNIVDATVTPNGAFGSKIGWNTFQCLMQELNNKFGGGNATQAELINKIFPNCKYIYIPKE